MLYRNSAGKLYRTLRDLQQDFRNVSFPRVIPEGHDFSFLGLDLVQETPRPPVHTGDTLSESVVDVAGTWTQQWSVSSPSDLTDLKDTLKDRARHIAEAKMQPPLTSTEVMTYQELYRYDVDQTPEITDYPLMAAIATGRGISNAAAITLVRNSRTTWLTRAANVQTKLHDILVRIDAATTTAALDALEAELEAFE